MFKRVLMLLSVLCLVFSAGCMSRNHTAELSEPTEKETVIIENEDATEEESVESKDVFVQDDEEIKATEKESKKIVLENSWEMIYSGKLVPCEYYMNITFKEDGTVVYFDGLPYSERDHTFQGTWEIDGDTITVDMYGGMEYMDMDGNVVKVEPHNTKGRYEYKILDGKLHLKHIEGDSLLDEGFDETYIFNIYEG